MIKTFKPQNKDANKYEDRQSSKNSEAMRTRHKFHPAKNSSKIIIEESLKNVKKIFMKIKFSIKQQVNNCFLFLFIFLKSNQHAKGEIKHYKLTNLEEFIEDTTIKTVRLEKEKQLKREEEEKKMKRIQEKVTQN